LGWCLRKPKRGKEDKVFMGAGISRVSLWKKVLAGGLISALLVSAGCAVNPATGERQFTLMTEAQEIQMGRDADPDIVAAMGLYPNEALQAYVQDLGEQLAAVAERPNLPWTFRVLDDPLINAFALPGGFIYMTRGIMAYLDSEAELVGVLGHEIGHVTARHSVSRISRAQLAQLGLGVGMILAPELQQFEGLASASLGLLFLRFSRDDERQSDALGVRYMSRLGYDPAELSGVMAMLGGVTSEEAGPRGPEWLSTHPNPENREQLILDLAARTEVARDPALVNRDTYLRRLDGLIFGENPREGFFRGRAFHHPDMAFSMDFPQGWRTANSKQAVQGLSPEEDALLVLSLGEGATPSAGLRSFLAQEGIQGGSVSEAAVNGLPAAAADFRFTSSDGTLDGRVVFIQHRGTLFRFLGYAQPSAWAARRSAVRASLESFRPLTDQRYLAVQPARLKVVTLSRSAALSWVLEQEGASHRIEEVQRLNRLEGNPPLPSGYVLKIPVGGVLPDEL
jgi:predicted Zn-dependent protease